MSTLKQRVFDCVRDRERWESRQRIWYEMRHDGLRRRSKPYPNAPDLHLPLVDTAIEKLKPFYLSQIYAGEQVASFTPINPELADASSAAAAVYDWRIRQETDFDPETHTLVDAVCLHGRGVMKLRWDPFASRLAFEEINPVYVLVPKAAVSLERADFVVHVQHLTVGQYKSERRYNQDPELVRRITGTADSSATREIEQEKALREGITHSSHSDTILLWEIYERTMGGWTIHTKSPCAWDAPIRQSFGTPYKMGGKAMLPFVGFSLEVKDKGWYSPRGIAERLAPYETYGTKVWNHKAEHLDFSGRPMFKASPGAMLGNTTNFRAGPGDIMPEGVEPATMPAPPFALDQEMVNTRLIAEQSIMLPDFGVGDQEGRKENKTATEVAYIQSIASQGVDLRGRIFRRSLSELHRKAWAIYVQFDKEGLAKQAARLSKTLPTEALVDSYLIEPDGSTDGWNKQARVQRALARYQMFRGHPNVNQEELVKSVLESDDPRLVKRLFISTNAKAANEQEDEATEIVLMLNGFPAQASPGENHVLRIQLLTQKLQAMGLLGAPVDPLTRNLLQAHLMQHAQLLQQENPQTGRQVMAALMALDSPHQAAQAGTEAPGPESGMPNEAEDFSMEVPA